MHGIVIIEKYYGMLLVNVLSNPRQCGISILHLAKKRYYFFLHEVSNQDTNDIFFKSDLYNDRLNIQQLTSKENEILFSLKIINLYESYCT